MRIPFHFRPLQWSASVLTILALTPLSPATEASAFELAAGFSVIEEGDDRLRPGLNLHLSPHPFYAGRLYLWGREYGPVEERTVLASFLRRWAIFRSKALTAAFGVAILNETTTLDFPSETPEDGSPSPDSFDKTESQWNAGPVFGVQAELPGNGPLHAAVSWDSHVFLAGPNGGLFLAYGRKQTVSVSLGMKF